MKLHLAELSRRGVFKTLAAYAVASWVLTEVVAVVGPAFLLPPWLVAAVTTIFVLGAFPVILLSWRYDITLEGIKRDTHRLPVEVEKSARIISGLIIVLLLSITAALWTNYYRAQSASEVDELLLAQQGAPKIGADGLINSIAVLPFDDYSPGGGRSLLADGIAEAILHVLAQDRNLVVTSRKSSFMFRDKDVSAAEIGRILNVQTLLEGSIQIVNDQLRVTSQLIRTSDQVHIWSNVYEAPLDDLFEVNDEIAADVRNLILPETQSSTKLRGQPHPPSIEAFQLLLEARELIEGLESTERAIRLINVIIGLWPDYADAHAWLAMALNEKADALKTSHTVSFTDIRQVQEEATSAAQAALELNPENPLAILFMGRTTTGITLKGYHDAIRMVMDLAPNDAQVLDWLGGLHHYVADFSQAEDLRARARAIDPASNDILESYLFTHCGVIPQAAIVDMQVENYPTSRVETLSLRSLAQFCDRKYALSIDTHFMRSRIDDNPVSAFNTLMFLAALNHEQSLDLVTSAQRLLPAQINGDFADFFRPAYFTRILPAYLDLYRRYIASTSGSYGHLGYVRALVMAGDYISAEKNLDVSRQRWERRYASEGGKFWQSVTLEIYAYKAWFHSQRGENEQAKSIAEELLQDLQEKDIDEWSGSRGRLADLPLMILLLNGRQQQALNWLIAAEQDRWLFFQPVLTSPVFAEFRDLPVVRETLERMVDWRESILEGVLAGGQAEALNPSILLETIESLARPTHHQQAQSALHFDDDPASAFRHYEKALENDPDNTAIIGQVAELALDFGLIDAAVRLGERAVLISPQDFSTHYRLSFYYACAGRWGDAVASAGTAAQLSPEIPYTHRMLGMALILNGESQAAMEVMQQIPDEMHRNMGLTLAQCAVGQIDQADLIFTQWMKFGELPKQLSYSLAFCDKPDEAFEWLYKAAATPSWVSDAAVHPFLTKLHDDPRWLPFLESIGKSPGQLAPVEFNVTFPD